MMKGLRTRENSKRNKERDLLMQLFLLHFISCNLSWLRIYNGWRNKQENSNSISKKTVYPQWMAISKKMPRAWVNFCHLYLLLISAGTSNLNVLKKGYELLSLVFPLYWNIFASYKHYAGIRKKPWSVYKKPIIMHTKKKEI